MVLRYVLSSWLQGLAREQLRTVVNDAARQQLGGEQGDETAAAAQVTADLAVAFAMGAELGGFEDKLTGLLKTRGDGFTVRYGLLREQAVLVLETGAGELAARHGAEALIAGHRPRWMISAGFSGGLQPQLKRNDIVMASSLIAPGRERLAVDFSISPEALSATPGLHVGELLMADKIILKPEDKQALGQQHGALAVDLESYAIADVCRREKIRFMAVRIISDAMTDELPPEVERLIAPQSAARRVGSAVGAIWNRPSSAKDMLQLRENALIASDRLATFLTGVLPQLK